MRSSDKLLLSVPGPVAFQWKPSALALLFSLELTVIWLSLGSACHLIPMKHAKGQSVRHRHKLNTLTGLRHHAPPIRLRRIGAVEICLIDKLIDLRVCIIAWWGGMATGQCCGISKEIGQGLLTARMGTGSEPTLTHHCVVYGWASARVGRTVSRPSVARLKLAVILPC